MLFKSKLKKLAIEHLDLYPYRRFLTKNKCIFVHIPKAAGTSILQALSGNTKHIQRDHFSIHDCISASRMHYEEYFSFSFTREPLDRAISTYNYLARGGNKASDLKTSEFLNKNFTDFDEFVDGFLTPQTIYAMKLTRPQFTYVCDETFTPLVDFIGSFENLEKDFTFVSNKIGLKRYLQKVNASEKGDIKVSELARSKIRCLYKKDYELFYPNDLEPIVK